MKMTRKGFAYLAFTILIFLLCVRTPLVAQKLLQRTAFEIAKDKGPFAIGIGLPLGFSISIFSNISETTVLDFTDSTTAIPQKRVVFLKQESNKKKPEFIVSLKLDSEYKILETTKIELPDNYLVRSANYRAGYVRGGKAYLLFSKLAERKDVLDMIRPESKDTILNDFFFPGKLEYNTFKKETYNPNSISEFFRTTFFFFVVIDLDKGTFERRVDWAVVVEKSNYAIQAGVEKDGFSVTLLNMNEPKLLYLKSKGISLLHPVTYDITGTVDHKTLQKNTRDLVRNALTAETKGLSVIDDVEGDRPDLCFKKIKYYDSPNRMALTVDNDTFTRVWLHDKISNKSGSFKLQHPILKKSSTQAGIGTNSFLLDSSLVQFAVMSSSLSYVPSIIKLNFYSLNSGKLIKEYENINDFNLRNSPLYKRMEGEDPRLKEVKEGETMQKYISKISYNKIFICKIKSEGDSLVLCMGSYDPATKNDNSSGFANQFQQAMMQQNMFRNNMNFMNPSFIAPPRIGGFSASRTVSLTVKPETWWGLVGAGTSYFVYSLFNKNTHEQIKGAYKPNFNNYEIDKQIDEYMKKEALATTLSVPDEKGLVGPHKNARGEKVELKKSDLALTLRIEEKDRVVLGYYNKLLLYYNFVEFKK